MRLFAQAPKAALDSPYARHVNPQWVRVLELMHMNVDYARCEGAELFTADGRRILDFLSGYCVHNLGHNHPRVVAALKTELDRHGPAMLQSHAPAPRASWPSASAPRPADASPRPSSRAPAARASRPPSSSRGRTRGGAGSSTPRAASTGSPAAPCR